MVSLLNGWGPELVELLQRVGRLRERDLWSRARLEAHQADELGRLRAHAYAHSPFYRRFHAGVMDRPLEELPVLTRDELMEHFDEIVTDPQARLATAEDYLSGPGPARRRRFLDRYHVVATPGTDGRRGVFLYDENAWLTALASMGRLYEWAGHRIRLTHRPTTATLTPPPATHVLTQLAATAASWGRWWPTLPLSADEGLTSMVERLNGWRPEVLGVFPSVGRELADEQLAGRLRIAPKLVTAGTEMLTPATRRRIREAWHVDPFEAYGATEMTAVAAECTHHRGLHLMEDLAIVEVVDDAYRPASPGHYGSRVLITVFASRLQPLIRYELTDGLRLARDACPCGRPFTLVDSLRGRASDVIRLPGLDGSDVAVWPATLVEALDPLPLKAWQVTRDSGGGLTLAVIDRAGRLNDEEVVSALDRTLATRGARPPSVTVRRVERLTPSADGRVPVVARSH